MDKTLAVHVGAEVVVIGGITLYFYQQNKKLQEQIDELKKELKGMAIHVNNVNRQFQNAIEQLYQNQGIVIPPHKNFIDETRARMSERKSQRSERRRVASERRDHVESTSRLSEARTKRKSNSIPS